MRFGQKQKDCYNRYLYGGTEMSIDRVSCDCWIAGKDTGRIVENPTWEDVKKMILSLDGWNRTLVTFGNYDEGYYMAIGAGNNGNFIAYVSYDDEERLYNLVNQNGDKNEFVELVVGGQQGRFPANTCVSQEMILSAAKKFFETHELAPDMK